MTATDTIAIEILDDGTIKVTTDPISGPNHLNAEQLLRFIAQQAGGETTRTRRVDVGHRLGVHTRDGPTHSHDEHDHGHHGHGHAHSH